MFLLAAKSDAYCQQNGNECASHFCLPNDSYAELSARVPKCQKLEMVGQACVALNIQSVTT